MSPRILSANHQAIRKQKRHAPEQANRDGVPMAVTQTDGLVFVRPLWRAQQCVGKHPDAQLFCECYPSEVTP